MIKSTVGELLDDTLWDRAIAYHDTLSWDDADAVRNALCVYVVRDGETIFYVGRSGETVNRLYDHMGLTSRSSASGLGHLIKALHPCLNVIHNEEPTSLPKRYKRRFEIDASQRRPPAIYNVPGFVEELRKKLGTGYSIETGRAGAIIPEIEFI